jgi:hypothetical protein
MSTLNSFKPSSVICDCDNNSATRGRNICSLKLLDTFDPWGKIVGGNSYPDHHHHYYVVYVICVANSIDIYMTFFKRTKDIL